MEIKLYDKANLVHIDSLDGLTFRNQLMSIMLVMPTGQHLHAIFSFLACPYKKMLKLDYAFFESMAENM